MAAVDPTTMAAVLFFWILAAIALATILKWVLEAIFWLHCNLGKHKWTYRNPYTRTCRVCGRQEDMYCWAWDLWRRDRGWWEVMRPGDPTLHEKERK